MKYFIKIIIDIIYYIFEENFLHILVVKFLKYFDKNIRYEMLNSQAKNRLSRNVFYKPFDNV